MTSKTIVGMNPCLVTHHTHKVNTLVVKAQELKAGLVKDGCPSELADDIDMVVAALEAIGTNLEQYKTAQENLKERTSEQNRQRRQAEIEARRAARAVAKASVKPTPAPAVTDDRAISITSGPEGVTATIEG